MTFAGFLWQPAEAGITYLKNIDRRDSCFNLFAIDYFWNPVWPMIVLYEQKNFYWQMYKSGSDCVVSTVVHELAMLWKEVIWFQASVTKVT